MLSRYTYTAIGLPVKKVSHVMYTWLSESQNSAQWLAYPN